MSSDLFRLAATFLFALTASLPAAAKITCCDVDGKRTCGDPPPPQCVTRAKIIYDKGGTAKEIEAPLSPEQRAAREAEAARQKEEAQRAAEQERKDRALLGSYTNAAEIDKALERALADLDKSYEQTKGRLEAALKRREKLAAEKEFYQKKPLPAELDKQIKDNERDIAALEQALKEREARVTELRARFAADKERFLQLTGRK
ncbi:MAG: hypothetical protein N3C63_04085 [Rhodocyclaceae bacterium]|nr:hypothetical protein [Rhodocyclaceae bacterium]